MNETVEYVQNSYPPQDVNGRRSYEEQRRIELEELERREELPPEDGKGQYIDVLA